MAWSKDWTLDPHWFTWLCSWNHGLEDHMALKKWKSSYTGYTVKRKNYYVKDTCLTRSLTWYFVFITTSQASSVFPRVCPATAFSASPRTFFAFCLPANRRQNQPQTRRLSRPVTSSPTHQPCSPPSSQKQFLFFLWYLLGWQTAKRCFSATNWCRVCIKTYLAPSPPLFFSFIV